MAQMADGVPALTDVERKCSVESDRCWRLRSNYIAFSSDKDAKYMGTSINTPMVRSLADLTQLLRENTEDCLKHQDDVDYMLTCLQLRNDAHAYLLNNLHHRIDFVKTCAASALEMNFSRPRACRQYDRANQKAIKMYRELWFRGLDDVFIFFIIALLKSPSPATKQRLLYFQDKTEEMVDHEVMQIISDINPRYSATRKRADDEWVCVHGEWVRHCVLHIHPTFYATTNEAERVNEAPRPNFITLSMLPGWEFEVGHFRGLMLSLELEESLIHVVLKTLIFFESSSTIRARLSATPNRTMTDLITLFGMILEPEFSLIKSFLKLPSSRIFIVELMLRHIFDNDTDSRTLLSRLKKMLDHPQIMAVNYSLERNIVSSLLSGARDYYDVVETSTVNQTRQTGGTMFQIMSDLRAHSTALNEEDYYWVARSDKVMSLFRGDVDVTEDGSVTITCDQPPKRSVWHYIFIPGLNDSYIGTGTDHLAAEISRLGQGDMPETFTQQATWTSVSDVTFVTNAV